MKVSLVMPTWNGGKLLEQVLDAVDRQLGADTLERIAVDSGSSDDTVTVLERHGFSVTHIDQRSFNHGATRDQGIAQASGDIVLLLTQDAIPKDDKWLEGLVEAYADPDTGAAYCRQIPRDDCNPFIARRLAEWTAGKTELKVQSIESPEAYAALDPMERLGLCAYDNVAGSVRKSIWQEHKFGRRAFGEDVAFGKKLILAGKNIVFQPKSAVIHSHNRSAAEEGKRIYCDHQNLRDLFGVHLMPTQKQFEDGVAWGEREYAKIVDELELPACEKNGLHTWARAYAFEAARGMYLGANSHSNMRGLKGIFYRQLDRAMHRGI